MKLSKVLCYMAAALSSGAAASAGPDPDCLFTNEASCTRRSTFRIPTAAESAVMARRVLALTKLGTLSTVFPSPHSLGADAGPGVAERRPAGMAGVPIGLVDYFADCDDGGNPTLLAIKIATSFRNIAAGSNVSLSLQWIPPYRPAKRIGVFKSFLAGSFVSRILPRSILGEAPSPPDPLPFSAANLPRFSLFGYTEWVEDDDENDASGSGKTGEDLRACFVAKHPDARYWMPGNRIHESAWMRLVVTHVYWIGGFGDRAYIGWIPVEDWRNVTREQWSAVRLQGETEGWNEWTPPTMTWGSGFAGEGILDL